jgi:catechol 2,3-dioxygenase-like lactoylglutathione lyase family enzyme
MPQLTGIQCVLAVKKLSDSVAFYRDQLGFSLDFEVEGWAFLSRDHIRLRLGECADALPASETGDHSYFAYVTVEAIDQLYAETVSRGVQALHTPADKPWGVREFAIRTPDGHRIMFGETMSAQA